MAVQRRGYIFSAFLLSVLGVLLVVVAVASNDWVVSTDTFSNQISDSNIRYGLFRGEITIYEFVTPNVNTLYMTCIAEFNACALSCKTNPEARQIEVRALAAGFRPTAPCLDSTDVDETNPLPTPPVISFAFYVSVLLILFLQLAFGVVSAALAILNATKNPTEPVCSLPGCLWSNVITAILGITSLLLFGIYWSTSGLNEHLAVSYVALGFFVPSSSIGYSYWILIVANLCPIANIALIEIRKYRLEKDPPPPEIKLENHSDGTIFLY